MRVRKNRADLMSRRNFLGKASVLSASAILSTSELGNAERARAWSGGRVGNSTFRMILSPQNGLRKARFTHVPSGLVMADGDYSYSFGQPVFQDSNLIQGDHGES